MVLQGFGAKRGDTARAFLAHAVLLSLLATGLLAADPVSAQQQRQDLANVQSIWNLPAPVLGVAGSLDGAHVAVLDDEARFTFILDRGERTREWQVPSSGFVGLVAPALAEVPPVPLDVAMTPDGKYWAGSVAYDNRFPGRVYGFAHWSDEPIWRYELPQPSWGQSAVRFTAMAAGDPHFALGTTDGRVLLFRAGDEGSTTKTPYRTYREDNRGNPFETVTDVAVSRDGKLVLIGTGVSGRPSLHVFSDQFFKATFSRITEPVEQVAIAGAAPRGAAVTGTGQSTRVHLVDLDTGRTLWENTIGATVSDLALSADGALLAVGSTDGKVHIFHERGGNQDGAPRATHIFKGQVTAVAVGDDARAVAVATTNGDLHFLDLMRRNPLWTYAFEHSMRGLALSGDTDTIAVGARLADEGRLVYALGKHDLAHFVAPEPRLLPGPGQAIPVDLSNNGNRMERITVEWRALPEGWVGKASNLSIAPGEQGTLRAELDVPRGQRADRYTIAFDLVSAGLRVPLDLVVRVPEVTMGRTITLWTFEHAVPGGGPAAFLFRLENLGNTENHVAVGYSGLPVGWTAEFTGTTEMRLRPGEDRQVALTARAPADAPKWREVNFDLVVAWQHGEERVPLRVGVIEHAEYQRLVSTLFGEDGDRGGDVDGVAPLVQILRNEAARGPDSTTLLPGGKNPLNGYLLALVLVLLAIVLFIVVIAVLGWRRAKQRGVRPREAGAGEPAAAFVRHAAPRRSG